MSIHKQDNAFVYQNDGGENLAKITFRPQGDGVIVADHTFVDPSLRGQGVAGQLLDALADYAREENLKIQAQCSYVVSAFQRYDRYDDVKHG
ncbi:N-acetyltransferase [Suttonella sp. R2A3]|uniref:GNAT family N-acetyltransferase n=1 Tax=Suttonella sp. R2A3 TaxID=2908648 RepID=UPI001F369080|nr:GNAT family N-acetyltransferase [Suttonella sp. R2A3]UJF25064.1 N-acetyltransferase [Suttonella sp. R2A3]